MLFCVSVINLNIPLASGMLELSIWNVFPDAYLFVIYVLADYFNFVRAKFFSRI